VHKLGNLAGDDKAVWVFLLVFVLRTWVRRLSVKRLVNAIVICHTAPELWACSVVPGVISDTMSDGCVQHCYASTFIRSS